MGTHGEKAKRVMLIGLDGADPQLIARYISEGRLPNIKRFIENGVSTEGLSMQGALTFQPEKKVFKDAIGYEFYD